MRADVVQFINRYIDSVEQLEVLLLMRRHPDKQWTAGEINQEIRSSETSISEHLKKFTHFGLIELVPGTAPELPNFLYRSTLLDHAVIEQLALSYRERRPTVIEYIYSKPIREIRSFSDAFKFRRKE